MRCLDCHHLVQHHYDDGCSRCPCKISNAEAGYRAMLHAEYLAQERARRAIYAPDN